MRLNPRPVLCAICLLAVVAMICFSGDSPYGVLANENEELVDQEHVEFQVEHDLEETEEFEGEDELVDDDWEDELAVFFAERKAVTARVAQLVDVATDEARTAAYVLEELVEIAEPEDTVRLLLDAAERTDRPVLKRMIQLKLIELYDDLDQPDEALNIARDLISGN